MLKQELLCYLDPEVTKRFLYLCKGSKLIVQEFYSNNWEKFAVLLAGYWRIDESKILKYKSLEEFKADWALKKVKNTAFTYTRFNNDAKAFEILAYAGHDWNWK